MCPSYMATREEKHSTRGRAHLLWELLQGEVLEGGWQNDDVKDALDLCLSCKACKTECPANVDVATYKAEFLAHYYEGRIRPIRAYAFGMVNRWAQLASIAPGMANFLGSAPGFSHIMKSILGLAPERQMPVFASATFRQWAKRNNVPTVDEIAQPATPGKQRDVVLWVDTFNNYFLPDTSRAALEVLQHAGFNVRIPRG